MSSTLERPVVVVVFQRDITDEPSTPQAIADVCVACVPTHRARRRQADDTRSAMISVRRATECGGSVATTCAGRCRERGGHAWAGLAVVALVVLSASGCGVSLEAGGLLTPTEASSRSGGLIELHVGSLPVSEIGGDLSLRTKFTSDFIEVGGGAHLTTAVELGGMLSLFLRFGLGIHGDFFSSPQTSTELGVSPVGEVGFSLFNFGGGTVFYTATGVEYAIRPQEVSELMLLLRVGVGFMFF